MKRPLEAGTKEASLPLKVRVGDGRAIMLPSTHRSSSVACVLAAVKIRLGKAADASCVMLSGGAELWKDDIISDVIVGVDAVDVRWFSAQGEPEAAITETTNTTVVSSTVDGPTQQAMQSMTNKPDATSPCDLVISMRFGVMESNAWPQHLPLEPNILKLQVVLGSIFTKPVNIGVAAAALEPDLHNAIKKMAFANPEEAVALFSSEGVLIPTQSFGLVSRMTGVDNILHAVLWKTGVAVLEGNCFQPRTQQSIVGIKQFMCCLHVLSAHSKKAPSLLKNLCKVAPSAPYLLALSDMHKGLSNLHPSQKKIIGETSYSLFQNLLPATVEPTEVFEHSRKLFSLFLTPNDATAELNIKKDGGTKKLKILDQTPSAENLVWYKILFETAVDIGTTGLLAVTPSLVLRTQNYNAPLLMKDDRNLLAVFNGIPACTAAEIEVLHPESGTKRTMNPHLIAQELSKAGITEDSCMNLRDQDTRKLEEALVFLLDCSSSMNGPAFPLPGDEAENAGHAAPIEVCAEKYTENDIHYALLQLRKSPAFEQLRNIFVGSGKGSFSDQIARKSVLEYVLVKRCQRKGPLAAGILYNTDLVEHMIAEKCLGEGYATARPGEGVQMSVELFVTGVPNVRKITVNATANMTVSRLKDIVEKHDKIALPGMRVKRLRVSGKELEDTETVESSLKNIDRSSSFLIADINSHQQNSNRAFMYNSRMTTVPQSHLCPITHAIMRDPVMCSDGYTYEKEAITRYLDSSTDSPITRQPMDLASVKPNRALKGFFA
jgi:hypothetical protein